MDRFSFQVYVQSAAFICIMGIVHLHVWSLTSCSLPFFIDIISTHPHIFRQSTCFLIEIITIFTNLLPAGCHSGICQEVITLSAISQPAAGNCHTGFVKIILILGPGCPSVT